MIEDDLRQLNERAADHSLDRLEADIWQGVTVRAQRRQATRKMASLQGVVMVAALLSSIAVGIILARPATPPGGGALLTSGIELTPSALLLGEHL
jgi:hypothetical protein